MMEGFEYSGKKFRSVWLQRRIQSLNLLSHRQVTINILLRVVSISVSFLLIAAHAISLRIVVSQARAQLRSARMDTCV